MTAGPRWRIVSDGTPARTKVYLGDVDVSDSVSGVAFYLGAMDGTATATVDLLGSRVDLDVDVAEADLDVQGGVPVAEDDEDERELPACVDCGHDAHPGEECHCGHWQV